jgi:hypothetical protein
VYSSLHIIGLLNKGGSGIWAGHIACMGEKRNVYKILAAKPEGKKSFGRPRRR